jgi:adenine-specific DNA-methyltransferase
VAPSVAIKSSFRDANAITLFKGDCLDLLRQIPDRSAQLVITSPPYNVGKGYERQESLIRYLNFQRLVIAECVRILRRGGSLCWQVGHYVGPHGDVIPLDLLLHPIFAEYESEENFRLRNRIIWHFEHGLHCSKRFSGRHESLLWYAKGDDFRFNLDQIRVPQKYPGKKAYKGPNKGMYSGNPLGKNPGDVWIFPNVKGQHIEKTEHPCQFPVELPLRLITAFTRPKDLVVDPFLGTGTTAAAAVLLGRRAAGSEISAKYFALAKKRVLLASKGELPFREPRPVYDPKPNTPLTTVPPHFKYKAPLANQGLKKR